MSVTASPLGSMNTTPRPAAASDEDLPGDQRGLAGPGRPADPQVVAAVGDGQADRAGRAGVADAQRPGVRAGERDGGRRGDGACPGAGQPGQRRVGRQPGDRREFGHRQQVAAAQPAGADRLRRGGAGGGGPASSARCTGRSPRPGRGPGRAAARRPARWRRVPASARPRPGRARRWWRRRSGSGFPIAGWPASRWRRGSRRPARDRSGTRCGGCRCWRGRRGWPGPAAGRSAGRAARRAACGRRGGRGAAGLR